VYSRNDIFVLPTTDYPEGFPRVVLEAWANGLYVVSSKVGGIEGLAKDRENILFFAPKNKEQLKNALRALIANSELRRRLKQGIESIQRKITFEYYSGVLIRCLEG